MFPAIHQSHNMLPGGREKTVRKRLANGKNLAKLIFVTAIILVLSRVVDFGELLVLLANLSLPLFGMVIVFVLADVVLMGLKWNMLLKAFHVPLGHLAAVITYLRSRVFAYVAPSTLGVDTYKIYFVKRYHRCDVAPVASSILIERVLGLLSALGVSTLLLAFALQPLGVEASVPVAAVALIGFGGLLFCLHLMIKYSPTLARIPLAFLPAKLALVVHEVMVNFGKISGSEGRLWWYFIYSMLEKLIYCTAVYFSALAIGFGEANYLYIVAATPFLSLLEKLPVSFSTIGIREGMFVLLFAPLGIDATAAVSIALVLRSAEIVQIALFSFIWLLPCRSQHSPNDIDPMQAVGSDQMPVRITNR
jgi:uncharacterized membrane protein YbhN (UPF0104 family)